MNLGKTIADKRKEKGLTQEQLAKKLKVSSSTISSWEHNKSEIDDQDLKKLEELLDFEVKDDEIIEKNTTLLNVLKGLYILILTIAPALYFYNLSINLFDLIIKTLNSSGDLCSSNIIGMESLLFQTLIIPYGYYTISIMANYIFTKCNSKLAFPIALVIEIGFFIEICILASTTNGITADSFLFLVPAVTGLVQYFYTVIKNK